MGQRRVMIAAGFVVAVAMLGLLRGCPQDPGVHDPLLAATPDTETGSAVSPEQGRTEPIARSGAFLLGSVVDDLTGVAVPNADVRVGARGIDVADDGSFTIDVPPNQTLARIAADGYADVEVAVEAGEQVVRLQRARGLSVRLVESGSQAPVATFEATLLSLPYDDLSIARRFSRVPVVEQANAADAGWVWFRDASPERFVVRCEPLDGSCIAPMPEVFAWQEGHAQLVLAAAPARPLAVRVVASDGAPLMASFVVSVVRDPTDQWSADGYREASFVSLPSYADDYPIRRGAVLVGTARTRSDGLAEVTAPLDEPISVAVGDGAMVLRTVKHRVTAEAGQELFVRLPVGVAVVGRVTPQELVGAIHPECAEFLQAAGLEKPGDMPRPTVTAVRPDAGDELVWQTVLDREGAFSFAHLPSGQWQLHLSYYLVEGPGSYQHRTSLVGEYAWWGRGRQEITVDASGLVPERIALDCHVAGAPVIRRVVEAHLPKAMRKVVSGRTDAGGTVALRVEPGRYVLACYPVAGAPRHRAVVELAAGAAGPFAVDFGTGPVEIRLGAGPGGNPIAARKVRLRALEFDWTSDEAVTDDTGIAIVEGVAHQVGNVTIDVFEAGTWLPHEVAPQSLAAQGAQRTVSVPLQH